MCDPVILRYFKSGIAACPEFEPVTCLDEIKPGATLFLPEGELFTHMLNLDLVDQDEKGYVVGGMVVRGEYDPASGQLRSLSIEQCTQVISSCENVYRLS